MSFYAYMLRCSDGSYYVGHTDNLDARIGAHHSGLLPGYTQKRRPVQLLSRKLFLRSSFDTPPLAATQDERNG